MNGLSLFSGIGGMDLGLKLALPGYRTVCYVEIEPYCQAILDARMADGYLDAAPLWDDIRTFDGRPWRGAVDILHGGYPCQPFSSAGRQRGIDDPRYLWPDIARIVRECEPEYCFFENVAGHLWLGFDVVARDLVQMGYRVAAGLFTAAELGAPHRRQRLFVLAKRNGRHDDGGGDAGTAWRVDSAASHAVMDHIGAWPPGPAEWDRWAAVLAIRPELAPAVADTDSPRQQPPIHVPAWYPRTDLAGSSGGMAETRLAPQSALRRVAHGLPYRVDRLKALGNAVVPAVAATAFASLWKQLTGSTEGPHRRATACH